MLEVLLQQYKILLHTLDEKCEEASSAIPEIPCRKGCFDCCKQLFPLSMVEAFYINEGFRTLPRTERRELANHAQKSQGKLDKLNLTKFETTSDSIEDIAEKRNLLTTTLQSTKIDCPLLTEGACRLYEYRNHDCRIHGTSFDPNTGEIVGCFRHPKIFSTADSKNNFIKKAVPSNHLYKEKSKIDSLLITELSQNQALKYCYYFTTPYIPLLKDFRETDWVEFFKNHSLLNNDDTDAPGDPDTSDDTDASSPNKYSLIIDLQF